MLTSKLLIPAVVGLVLLATGGKKDDAPAAKPKPGANSTPPPELLQKIAAAFQAADPANLRAVADEVERAGFKAQADDLRAFASKIETEIRNTPVPAKPPSTASFPDPPAAVPTPAPAPVPAVTPAAAEAAEPAPSGGSVFTLPEIVITPGPDFEPQRGGITADDRMLAGRVALNLRNVHKGREDKALIQRFQAREQELNHGPGGSFGSTPSIVDGMYGPKLALVLARHYAIVPPKPLYWGNNWLQDKKNYRAELARFAAVDPQRADEWIAAGKVL